MDRKAIYQGIIIGLSVVLISSFTLDFWSSVGLGLLVFIFFNYLKKLGRTIPIMELLLLISALQWIFGAHYAFALGYQHFKYYMYVSREEYMGVVVPGLLAFTIGIAIIYPRYNFNYINWILERFTLRYPNVPIYLIIIGVIAPTLRGVAPNAISFIFFLLGNFKFIGAVLLLFQPGNSRKWWFTALLMLLTLIGSIQSGMFHDLILWLALMFSFIVYRMKLPTWVSLGLIFCGFIMIFLIQSVKAEFRKLAAESVITGKSRTEVFVDLITDRTGRLGDLFSDDQYLGDMNVRLNQGWIISAIIRNVPEREPFANGETILEAVRASLLPRFLDPGKKRAGGQENFERFTGLQLYGTTSMGTSIIGEAYANFGRVGSWIFMFCWGLFLSWGYGKLVKYGNLHPIIHVFIPLIFLQVVKAETETYVVLNHFVKSTILVFLFLWAARRFLKWKV